MRQYGVVRSCDHLTGPFETLAPSSLRPQGSRGVVAASLAVLPVLGAVWLLTGWWGVGIGCTTALLTYRMRPSARVVAVFAAMLAAALALASGPWHSPTGYHGDEWWTQFPALVAITILVWSTVFTPARNRSPDDPSAARQLDP